MDKQDQKQDTREYTIKIIPHHGETVHSIRLPIRMVKYGVASLCVGFLLFVGAFGYASYSVYATQNETVELNDLRQVNNIQQEQLLQLSKKANGLQDEMDKLSQMENELRQISGAGTASITDNEGADGTHDGQGGPWIEPNLQNVSTALNNIEKNIAARKQSLEELKQQLKEQQNVAAVQAGISRMTPSIWPASGDVSSPFGMRWGGSDFHPGIDIANDEGTPILATADGVVTAAGWNSGGYGNMVDINHGNGIMTRYGHARQVVVSIGQQVKRGQIIAYMGSTGFSTGPHVHYEVRVNGQPVNPVNYL
ncbi:MAG: M23 family metallopeptidase [Selenomonadaceae bacterium]